MKNLVLIIFAMTMFIWACNKNENPYVDTSDKIFIDSLTATYNTVKAWDTTTINCYARGDSLTYSWECDHGNFNGSGTRIKYAAGECCVGTNTITCSVSNNSGQVFRDIKIEVTSYYEH